MNKSKYPQIALIGNGSMGKEISKIALEREITISRIFDENNPLLVSSPNDFDVAIDFSTPNAVVENIKAICILQKNIVVGTTGWSNHLPEIQQLVDKYNIGVVYGSNYSIGMQMYYRIIQQAARLVNTIPDYDIFMQEIHHKRKLDSPSGTALSLGKIVLEEVHRKSIINSETCHGKIAPEEFHISSLRGGEVTGTHTVMIDSLADTIEISHRAKNRSGFASGALVAADWIWMRQGLYEFTDQFENIMNSRL